MRYIATALLILWLGVQTWTQVVLTQAVRLDTSIIMQHEADIRALQQHSKLPSADSPEPPREQ